MKYKMRRRLYSQNFLHSPELVTKLVGRSSIGKKDFVLEIGAGRGIITQELINVAGKVIVVELDQKLFLHLRKRFRKVHNIEMHCANFLNFAFPNYPYKVFANIPFNITSAVLRKLTGDDNFTEGYLIVQKEAAQKFIGKPYDFRNQMMATFLKPWFEISVFWNFNQSDFIPKPSVDCVMIKIKRLEKPLIPVEQKETFRDFVLYIYNRSEVSKMKFEQIVKLFENFLQNTSGRQKQSVVQKARKILNEQKYLHKIHRTRIDKNWRRLN